MSNLLSCNLDIIGSYGNYPDTAFSHLQKIGVKYVEIPVPPVERAGATQEVLSYFDLSAASLVIQGKIEREQIADDLLPGFQTAENMGVKIVFISVKAGDIPLETVYTRLRKVGDAAASHGVTVALETHPDLCENALVALRTMDAVDHPNIRLNFDTANVFYHNKGDVDGVADLSKIAKYVVSIHLKDTRGGYRNWQFPTLGEGIVDFKGTFRVMNEIGFHGPFTMELEGVEGEELNLRRQHERVEKSVEHLRDIGAID